MFMTLLIALFELPILLTKIYWQVVLWFVHLVIPIKRKCIKDQVVLITGAGAGIGKALANRFAEEGAKVAVVDINKESVLQTARELNGMGSKVQAYQCDVTKRNLVSQLASEVRRDFGDIDILVNNAGIFNGKELLNLTEGEIRRAVDVDVISMFWMLQEFLPAMKKHNSGHIINMSSIAGKIGMAMGTDYCATKHAIMGLTEALKEELRLTGNNGVSISVVCPMSVNTDILKHIQLESQPISRFAPPMEPEYVAKRIVEAVLRDEFLIYVPRPVWIFEFLNSLCPVKAMEAVRDYSSIGYFQSKKIA